jgi:hypothetical protein
MQEPDSRNNDERRKQEVREATEEEGCWKVFVTIVLVMLGLATMVFGICFASFR